MTIVLTSEAFAATVMTIYFYYRYGKFVVINLMDVQDPWTIVNMKFEEVKKGLLSDLTSKELMKDEK